MIFTTTQFYSYLHKEQTIFDALLHRKRIVKELKLYDGFAGKPPLIQLDRTVNIAERVQLGVLLRLAGLGRNAARRRVRFKPAHVHIFAARIDRANEVTILHGNVLR